MAKMEQLLKPGDGDGRVTMTAASKFKHRKIFKQLFFYIIFQLWNKSIGWFGGWIFFLFQWYKQIIIKKKKKI